MRQKRFAFVFVIFILLIVILADSGNLPRGITRLYSFSYGDKVGHFLLMGLLGFFLNRATLASHPNDKPALVVLKVSAALAFFVAFEEISQQYFPYRTFSMVDLAFSLAGVAIFSWLAFLFRRKEMN